MRLEIVTPVAPAVETTDVVALRAEDASGAFGIWPGHADLVTVLEVSVVSWRLADGTAGHCAVRGGVLSVHGGIHGGTEVTVATPEAVAAVDLETLQETVVRRLRTAEDETRDARVHARRLHLAALDQLLRHSREVGRASGPGGFGGGRALRDDGP